LAVVFLRLKLTQKTAMEEYKDEYTSFEKESKTQEIIGTVVVVCFCVAICGYFVYDLIASAPVYSSVMGFVFVAAVALYFLLCRPLKNIDVLERRICKRLDKQGYPHEKREGTLYVTKNDQHFRVHIVNSCEKKIKQLYFVYEFGDDNFEKVSMDGWTRAANSINLNNSWTVFVTLEDHFCCCYQSAILNSRDFMKEFDRAYRAIGGALEDYRKIYPYLERDYPNNAENKTIGFK
jgi:hypothetical protein